MSFLLALSKQLKVRRFAFSLIFLWLLFMIGLRQEIGADWNNYLVYYRDIIQIGLRGIFITEPGYGLLNYISGQLDGGIYLTNTLSALLFLFGLLFFIKDLPYKSLAIVIASYLIFVVAMGYSRQAIAISIVMVAYKFYMDKKNMISIIIAFLAL